MSWPRFDGHRHPLEYGPDVTQAVAGEQVARMLVGDRQRIAVDPAAGPELALEARGPEIIGLGRVRRHDAGMHGSASTPALRDESLAHEQVADGADGRPDRDAPVARSEVLQQLLGAPLRVGASGRAEPLGERGGNAMGAMIRSGTPIGQGGSAAGLSAVNPLVAGRAAVP